MGANGLKILLWNCNGLNMKITVITDIMDRKGILVATIQENNISSKNRLITTSCYSVRRQNRDIIGGIAFLIYNTIDYIPLPRTTTDPHLKIQGIAIMSGEVEIKICNIPPITVCQTGHKPTMLPYLTDEYIILLGDVNAHHDSLFSELGCDTRGDNIAEQVSSTKDIPRG